MSIHEKYAKLREQYPDDLALIETEEKRVDALLEEYEYSMLEPTQRLIALCKAGIVFARKRLATERSLTEEQRRELWAIVDARQWFLELVCRNYEGELVQIEADLDAELRR